jgi:DNA topoisomerase-1
MSKLLIVESPSKAKTIGKYLGKDFVVKASIGHIRDLPKSNKNAVDIENGFVPHYEVSKGKEKTVADITEAAARASEILLATDADREGEAIAWHLAELLRHDSRFKKQEKIPIQRITYHEITKRAIEEALKHPRAIDQNLRRAQEARRVLDRLVGYDLSGLIWKKLRYGLSAGRVQSPALRILSEREREIKAFVPEKFWKIFADVKTKKGEVLTLTCADEPKDAKETERILSEGKKADWIVKEVSETETKRAPRPPFITSSLQQVASTRLGFSPKRTMLLAQKLYEAGHITYMRTDSTDLSSEARAASIAIIEKTFGKENALARDYKGKVKNAQEAHEAIRPTDLSRSVAGSTAEQKRLYELIWRRTIASQMTDANVLRTKILAGAQSIPDFIANGSRILSLGWLLADPAARGEEVELPKVIQGDNLSLLDIRSEEKQTEPPSRWSEAGLVKELEKRGIGRPSTYASIIETLFERGYVEKEGRALRVTDTGDAVSMFLEKYFSDYISDSFTAQMEDQLDDIASGSREYEKTLRDFYTPFNKEVKKQAKDAEKINSLGNAPVSMKCPLCESGMEKKLSRVGAFYSCKKFPDCKGARKLDGSVVEEKKPDVPLGIDPATGKQVFSKEGRFGPYVQLGEKIKGGEKPKMSSIPKNIDPKTVTLELALKLLSLPRILGINPTTNKEIIASRGRFGPYVVHDGDFRSLKEPDNPYNITLTRALEILKEPKKPRGKSK